MNDTELKERYAQEPWGKLLIEMGMEPYDTESSARRVAEYAAFRIDNLKRDAAMIRDSSKCAIGHKVKIIQLLMTPNDSIWQGVLLGLGDDGVTYHCRDGYWDLYIPSLANVELVHHYPRGRKSNTG